MTARPTLRTESPDQPDVVALIEALDRYQLTLYPPESCQLLDVATLCLPNVTFAVARDARGRAVGCGAIVAQEGYGELKRMYVDPTSRGAGTGRALLEFLEARARAAGIVAMRLETGPLQPEALAMYERAGYRRCGRYGSYPDDALSIYMDKALSPTA